MLFAFSRLSREAPSTTSDHLRIRRPSVYPRMSGTINHSTGISEGASLIVKLYDTVKAVKICKTRLYNLARHCDGLLSTVREYSQRFVGTQAGTEADEIERAIEKILARVTGWSRLSDAAAFIKQSEIQVGIEECHRELAACTDRFMVALSMVKKSESQERELARLRDHQQLIDMIADLREEVRKRGRLVTSEAPQPRETLPQTQVMELDVQGGVQASSSSPRPKSAADYSGRVSKVSKDPVIEGTQLVFYTGEWTSDDERTALGRLRDQSPNSQKRFKEWIEASLSIHHRNIHNFVGHVTIDDVVYSINPWMENGNIREYIQKNPDVGRVRLLSEAASGVEFLHERDIIHGELCDKNILINRDGKAIVCGFDLFKFSNPAESRARWLAPERITATGVASPTVNADIWSFGLLCLEVFTGKDPYHSYSDLYIVGLLARGTPPEHPESEAVGLSPEMWDLMKSCWQIDPEQRPSMSKIQSTIRDLLPPRDPHQPPPRNVDLSVPTLFTSPTDPVTANDSETKGLSVGMGGIAPPLSPLSSLSPLNSPMPAETSPVAQVPTAAEPTNFLKPIDRQNEIGAPIRRSASESPSYNFRRLPTLSEGPSNHDMLGPPLSAPPQQRMSRGEHKQARPFTAPTPSVSAPPPPDSRRQLSIDSNSSSSHSTSGKSESTRSKRRLFSFSLKRSQTASDTPPSVNGDSLDPGTLSRGNSIIPHAAPANSPSPNRSKTTPIKKVSKMMARQPSRAPTLSIMLPQSRKWDPINPAVLKLLEQAATGSGGLLRSATDGTVSVGNLEGLVSRVISDIDDPSKTDHYRVTFLTIYQLFATSERLFDILKGRFETTELKPVTVRSRYSILLFIESWLKKGFEDEGLKCSSMIKEFVLALVASDLVSETMQTKAGEIASLIDEPNYVRLRQPKNCTPLRGERAERPQGVTPVELACALTVVAGDRFRCITYWDYVNFTRQRSKVRRIEVFNIVHDLVTVWVQTAVLHHDFVDERMKVYEEWINTAEACRASNDFSSTSAIVVALMSPMVAALSLTCESKARHALCLLAKELTPSEGAYQSTLEKLETKDLIPWLDLHLSALNSSFAHSNPVVEIDGHPLIDFKQCNKVAEQIEALVQYSPSRTRSTARSNVLAYVEYSLKSCNGDDALRAARERSAKLASEEQSLLADRKKMQSLGFPWSPPRRRMNPLLI